MSLGWQHFELGQSSPGLTRGPGNQPQALAGGARAGYGTRARWQADPVL